MTGQVEVRVVSGKTQVSTTGGVPPELVTTILRCEAAALAALASADDAKESAESVLNNAFIGHVVHTAESQGPMTTYYNGAESNYLEFYKYGHAVRGSIGALGAFEMNMSYNMDYKTGVHKYYDLTQNAWWIAMNDAGVYLQFAPKNYVTNGDIWNEQGRPYAWRVEEGGHQTIGSHLTIGELVTDFAVIETADTTANMVINTNNSMVFNIDANNDVSDRSYIWGANRSRVTGGATLMVLQEDGKLGLGKSSPAAILDVAGTCALPGGFVDPANLSNTQWSSFISGNKLYINWKDENGVSRQVSLASSI